MSHPETITIQRGCSSATVYLFGATLTSWKPKGTEVLFLSKNSNLDGQKPIRGGVPVIFPHFGPWEHGPQHGFARRTKWSIKDDLCQKSDNNSVTFLLKDTEETRKLWNYKFQFEYSLNLLSDSELKMEAVITNTDEKYFDFTFLLHTYFGVPDIENCSVVGLNGCSFIDKVKGGQVSKEVNEKVTISEFTDRVYENTPSTIKVEQVAGDHQIVIEKVNLPDTVVWNPWVENAKKMEDFGDEEWKQMICVEAGHVTTPFSLKPGESYRASQLLTLL